MTDLNLTGESHAHSLVAAGKVNRDAGWGFSAADGDKLLGPNGDDWGNYSKFFLGLDRGAAENTKQRYKYPVGKGGEVYRQGVIAAKQRAAQSGAGAVEAAASKLLELIDKNKSFCIFEECSVSASEDGTTALDFTISTSTIDRMGDTIAVDGWKLDNYRKNPVVLWSHDPAQPVGRARNLRIDGTSLKASVDFYPGSNPEFGGLAESLRQLYAGGWLRATSVGFRPLKWDVAPDPNRKSGIDFLEQELLEFSMVAIPANPEALISAKAAGVDISRLFAMSDADMLEAVEDMLERRDLFAIATMERFSVASGVPILTPARAEAIERAERMARHARQARQRNRELDLIKLK